MRSDKTYYTDDEISREIAKETGSVDMTGSGLSDGGSADDMPETEAGGSGNGGGSSDIPAAAGTEDGGSKQRKQKKKKNNGRGRSGRMNGSGGGRKRNIKKTVAIVIVCLLVLAGSGVGLAYGVVMNKLDTLNHDTSLDTSDLCISDEAKEGLKDYTNIVLCGIDDRKGEDIEHCRSDAIVIASINNKTNKVKIFTILRDSYLQLDENNTLNIDKVTHAHAYNGPKGLIRALNRNLDLNITNYVRVDWGTVADTVDAMGGLRLNVTKDNIAEMNRYIADTNKSLNGSTKQITHSGYQTLNGVQTVTYCRIRHVDGDNHRAKRIRATIEAAVNKAKTMNLSKLNKVANVALPEVKTSLSSSTIMSMLLGISSYDVENVRGWPYEYFSGMINGVSYDVPVTLETNVQELHKKIFGQDNYQCSDTVKQISQAVSEKSGKYEIDDDTITSEDVMD
ncbi:MAG: LCP family protein [Eubacteriaceae bacterium]|jgi:LCP family protein required for cell wall assembly|nr:LCP family protein [Eubacteriaceae bacterium]